MTRIAMHALYRRFQRYVAPVLILLAIGSVVFRDWGGTPAQLAFEFTFLIVVCSVATELVVLITQRHRPWMPRPLFVWRRMIHGVGAGAGVMFLAVFGGWFGRVAAVGLIALFAFIWLRLRH